jgi:hypothetical protein
MLKTPKIELPNLVLTGAPPFRLPRVEKRKRGRLRFSLMLLPKDAAIFKFGYNLDHREFDCPVYVFCFVMLVY